MRSAFRATVLIAVFSLLSKLLGLVRWMVFSNRLGAGEQSDIYVAAFRVPDLLFNLLILGTLSAAFIPVFVRYLQKDKNEAFIVASSIFNLTLLVMAVLGVLGAVLAPQLTNLIVPGFSAAAKAQTALYTRIFMLSPLLFSLSSVATSILHSYKRFLLAAVAPLFYNIAIIIGVIFFYPVFGLSGVVWSVVVGAGLHFLIQLPSVLRLGLRPLLYLRLGHEGLRKISKLFLPRVIGIGLGQISLLVASVIGSSFVAGSLTSYYYAYDLNTIPLGIFAIPFAVAAFPYLSEYLAKNDLESFRNFIRHNTVQILFLIIPVSVLMLLLRAQIVRLVYGAGQSTAFDFSDTRLTAQTLGFFTLSFFSQALIPLLARAFYAMQNTVVPVVSGLISAAVMILLSVKAVSYGGPDLLALAFSVASVINMLLLFVILRIKVGDFNDSELLVRGIKIVVASIVMGMVCFVSLYAVAPLVDTQTYFGILIQAGVSAILAVITYLGMGILIGLPETRQTVKVLQNWFTRFSRPVTSVVVNMFTDIK